jgi:hypothetical protein
MPRKPRDQMFKKSDVYRLIETAKAKGLSIAGIEVTRDGLRLTIGEPAKEAANKVHDVEEWISKHQSCA